MFQGRILYRGVSREDRHLCARDIVVYRGLGESILCSEIRILSILRKLVILHRKLINN